MLYDNALLSYVYLEAYQMSKKQIFREVAERVLHYVLSELTHENGGFYCGQDADSSGEEGKFYLFTKKEILEVLGDERGDCYCKWFGVTEKGNFEGKNILNLIANEQYDVPNPQVVSMSQVLEKYRKSRTELHRDDKILTSWNGLMIAAFAKGYQVLGKEQYLNAAKRADEFIKSELMTDNGRLRIRYRDGECRTTGKALPVHCGLSY